MNPVADFIVRGRSIHWSSRQSIRFFIILSFDPESYKREAIELPTKTLQTQLLNLIQRISVQKRNTRRMIGPAAFVFLLQERTKFFGELRYLGRKGSKLVGESKPGSPNSQVRWCRAFSHCFEERITKRMTSRVQMKTSEIDI